MSSQDEAPPPGSKEAISSRERRLVAVWAAGLLLVYVVGGGFGIRQLQGYKVQTEAVRQEWLSAATGDTSAGASVSGTAAEGSPVDVVTGIRVKRVGGFSLKEAEWTADFDIWFRWSGEAVHPGETFEVVNGDIQRREKIEAGVRNGQKYERYYVTARMTKQFDPSRFPFADEGLTIDIQDNRHEAAKLRYVADDHGSGMSPDGLPPGVRLERAQVIAAANQARPGKGGTGDAGAARSRLVFAMLVTPLSISFYGMMFQALFASVAVAMIAFFIRPINIDCRFGLPVGAFFAAVTNNVFVGGLLPHADRITLVGMVNAVSLVTIFLILVQSAIALCIQSEWGRKRLSVVFDRVSFAVMLPCYIGINLTLPWAAMPS